MRKSYIWGIIRVKDNNRNRNIAWIWFLLSDTYRSSKDIFGRFDLVKLSSNLDRKLTMTHFHVSLCGKRIKIVIIFITTYILKQLSGLPKFSKQLSRKKNKRTIKISNKKLFLFNMTSKSTNTRPSTAESNVTSNLL